MATVETVFLDVSEQVCFVRLDATSFIVDESAYRLDATFPFDKDRMITNGMLIGFQDVDSDLVFYEVINNKINPFDNTVAVYAEHAAMTELRHEVVTDERPSDAQASTAVQCALRETRWQVRTIEDVGIGSSRFWYCSAWSALQKVISEWGCALKFAWEIDDTGIIGRYVDIKASLGEWRGKRYELSKAISSLKVFYDDSDVCTALYGRGKNERKNNDEGDAAYCPKATFADIVWSKANGDPADKPLGQEWVEDTEATAALGRKGRKRTRIITFDDCGDKNQLLRLTWDALQKLKVPKLTIQGAVTDLEMAWGHSFEAVRLGDTVAFIIDDIDLQVYVKAISIKRNYVHPDKTMITLGNEVETISDIQAKSHVAMQTMEQNQRYESDTNKLLADTIAMQAKVIEAKADLILLDAYVKATDLEANILEVMESANIYDLTVTSLNAYNVAGVSASYDNMSVDTLTIDGTYASWEGQTVLTGIGTLKQEKRYLSLMTADGGTVTLDIVTDVSITPDSTYITYLGG